MYELIILSLLMRQPAHGYLIARIINNIIGPIARASNGRIYPLLAKLEEGGLITASEEVQEGRPVRTFAITDRGRVRFHQLIMDTTSSPREYQELFSFKVSVMHLILPAERLRLIDHYTHYCRSHILHLEAGAAELERARPNGPEAAAHLGALMGVMRHRIAQWQLEIAWAESLREQHAQ